MQRVPADADQPGLEVRAPVEGGERLEHLEEDVLRQVFRSSWRPTNLYAT